MQKKVNGCFVISEWTPLFYAITCHNNNFVKQLIKNGANVNVYGKNWRKDIVFDN